MIKQNQIKESGLEARIYNSDGGYTTVKGKDITIGFSTSPTTCSVCSGNTIGVTSNNTCAECGRELSGKDFIPPTTKEEPKTNKNGWIKEDQSIDGLSKPTTKECLTCGRLKESSPTPDGDEICPDCGGDCMDYEGENTVKEEGWWEKDFDKQDFCWTDTCVNERKLHTNRDVTDEVKAFIRQLLASKDLEKITGETSDGYHTFNELYEFRKLYNAALFNEWAKQGKFNVHKSKKHSDGEDCFGGGWFIVMAELPTGQISNHYELKDWDLFICEEREKADVWDGHTAQDVAERLDEYLRHSLKQLNKEIGIGGEE